MVAENAALSLVGNQSVSLQFSRDQIELVKRTVAKGSTDDELQMFLYLAQKYGLDPFRKEIWFIKRAKKNADGKYDYENAESVIMTSRDGYLKIAQSDPDFDGVKSFVVKEGDHFEIDAMTDQVVHRFGMKRGKIMGAWAIAYHKKRKPVICFVEFDEYKGTGPIWSKYPSAMIQKVAEVFVLKRQYSINGLVTQEEIETNIPEAPRVIEGSKPQQLPSGQKERAQNDPNAPCSDKQRKAVYGVAKGKGLADEQIKAIMVYATNKENSKDMTMQEASDLIQLLQSMDTEELLALIQQPGKYEELYDEIQ